MFFASAHIKKLLPYRSYKVYPPTLAEMARSSAHISHLLPYHSYKYHRTTTEIFSPTDHTLDTTVSPNFISASPPGSTRSTIQVKQLQGNFFVYSVRSKNKLSNPEKRGWPLRPAPVRPKASALQDYFPRKTESFRHLRLLRRNWNQFHRPNFITHIEKLLPYRSYKVYPSTLAEMARSSAHISHLLPYHSYKYHRTTTEIFSPTDHTLDTTVSPNFISASPPGSTRLTIQAHIEKLLPYRSYKVYPSTLAEMARSSAHISHLLPYHSYKYHRTTTEIFSPTDHTLDTTVSPNFISASPPGSTRLTIQAPGELLRLFRSFKNKLSNLEKRGWPLRPAPVRPKASTLQDYFPRKKESFAVYVFCEETGTNSTDQTS
ncbi:hypothetical protein Glove_95g38 [Diversispora epigaea]|uniref:Uncharacterized protein n=1 Tax=Diversispora epigaea TaxID=1348612 RepID=A0A397J5M6_9GLOM|nr:hypothetical protein Glove_95g38 [Diversispora epigaea]